MLAGKGKNRSIYVCIASTINLFIFFGGDAQTLFLTQLIAGGAFDSSYYW